MIFIVSCRCEFDWYDKPLVLIGLELIRMKYDKPLVFGRVRIDK